MKKFLVVVLATMLTLSLFSAPTQAAVKRAAVPATTYDAYSMMLSKAAGKHASNGVFAGQWGWNPQSSTQSLIGWGDPAKGWPPPYNENFLHQTDTSGDWVRLDGWYDNGTYYKVKITTEWQAQADCRTGRTFLPSGGAQHYARWTIPTTAYCLYADGIVTEQSSGNSFEFIHQQVWSPPATCPALPAPVQDEKGVVRLTQPQFCTSQWESWADANGTSLQTKLERTVWQAQGFGMALKTVQTFPSLSNGQAWTSYMTNAWLWG